MPRTIIGKTKAYITGGTSPEILTRDNPDGDAVVAEVVYSNFDMTDCGWSLVGEAEIRLEVPDERQLVENKVESLRAERRKVLADAEAKATSLDRQIQTLLAISYEPT